MHNKRRDTDKMRLFKRSKMYVNDAVELYLLRHEAGNSSRMTLRNYRYRLRPLCEWYGDVPINKLSEVQLLRLMAHIRGLGFKDTSVNCFVQALKAFFNWAYLSGHTDKKLSEYIHRKAPRDLENRAMSMEDFKRMVDACEHYRNKAILIFQLDTAARTGEIITLTKSNLRLASHEATVTGKTGTRVVWFTEPTATVLREYLDNHRPDAPHDYVFTNLRAPYDKLSCSHSLFQIYAYVAKKAGVTGRFNPHSIRHMVAKHFILNGNMEAARIKLGHEFISTTQQYANSDSKYGAEATNLFTLVKQIESID